MNTDNGTLSFATGIDTSGFERGMERLRAATESMDKVISGASGSVVTLSDKQAALSKACDDFDKTIRSLTVEMDGYRKTAEEAFTAGDMDGFDAAATKISELQVEIQKTSDEARGYADALAFVSQQMGMVAQAPTPPMYFTQDQLDIIDGLKERLASLYQQLAETPETDAGYESLRAEISDTTRQINDMEKAAATAAARLGTDLGGRASEASMRLHEANKAVEEQKKLCQELEKQTAAAAEQLKTLKESMADPSEIATAQMTYDNYVQSLQNAQMRLIAMQGAQNDARDSLARVSSEVDSHNSVMVKMLGGHEKFNQILSGLPAPLQSAISGITGMTGAAKAFIATPLGAVIAAITLAIQALVQWFNSSVEGQMRFAEISGYVSGVLGQLKEIVISVGKAIYNAFTNPKDAARQFLDFLKSQVVNRIKALGEVFGALGDIIVNIFKGNIDAAKNSLKEMGEAYTDFLTGVENTTDKLAGWGESVSNAAKATAQISRASKELQMETSRWQQKEAEYNNQMTELYTKMMDSSLSKEQHKKYKKDYEDLVQLVADQKVKLAQKAVDLQQQKMSLTTNSMEDEMELDSLNTALVQAQGYKAERMRAIQRMTNRMNSSSSSTAAKPAATAVMEGMDKNADRQMERALKDAEFGAAQARIDAMEEGEARILEQMKLNHEKELEELQRQREDYLQKKIETARIKFNADAKNQGKQFDSSSITLTDAENAIFDAQEADVKKKQQNQQQELVKAQQEAMNQYLAKWGEYTQKRQAIIDIANDKMAEAQTEGERKSIAAQLTKDLADLDMEASKTTNAISVLFRDMAGKTVSDLRKMASEGQKALDLLKAKEYDKEQGDALGITKEMWETLKKSPDELEKITKAIKDISKEADSLGTPIDKITKGFDDLFNSDGDKEKLKKALSELKQGLGELFAAVSVVSGALSSLGDAFGSGVLSGIADGLNTAMEAVNGALSGAQAGAVFGPWGAAAGAAIGLVGSLGSAIARMIDKGHERKIQKLQEQIEALDKSYSALEKEIEKAYSKDASDLIEQNNKLLEQKKTLIRQQMAEEEAKKKTDKDRLKEWQEQIDAIDEAIADGKQKAVDAIFGEDLKTAIENFATAYAEAWQQGESRAKSAKDTVREMMRKMVEESIKAAIESSGAMERIRQQLEAFYADNILEPWEQRYVLQMAEELQKQLDEQFGWADSLMSGSQYEQSGSNGGFQTMSEETGAELNGRFTALQISSERSAGLLEAIYLGIETIEWGLSGLGEGMTELQNINLLQLEQLEIISGNTRHLQDMAERLEQIERNTKNL